MQFGITPGRGTRVALLVMIRMQEKCRDKEIKWYMQDDYFAFISKICAYFQGPCVKK